MNKVIIALLHSLFLAICLANSIGDYKNKHYFLSSFQFVIALVDVMFLARVIFLE